MAIWNFSLAIETISMTFEWEILIKRYERWCNFISFLFLQFNECDGRNQLVLSSREFDRIVIALCLVHSFSLLRFREFFLRRWSYVRKEWFPWSSRGCHRQYLDSVHNKLTASAQTIRIESDSEKFDVYIQPIHHKSHSEHISESNRKPKLIEHNSDHWAIERSLYQ